MLTWFKFSYHFERSCKIMRLIIISLSSIMVITVTVLGLVLGRCQCNCPFWTHLKSNDQTTSPPVTPKGDWVSMFTSCLAYPVRSTHTNIQVYVFIFDSFIWLYWTCLGLQVGVKVKQIKTNTVSTEPISIHITSFKCMYVSSYIRKYICTFIHQCPTYKYVCMYVKLSSRLWPVEMISKFRTSAYSLVRTLVAAKMIRIFLLTSSLTFPNNIEKLHQCAA